MKSCTVFVCFAVMLLAGCASHGPMKHGTVDSAHTVPAAACPDARNALAKALRFAEDQQGKRLAAGKSASDGDVESIEIGRSHAGALVKRLLALEEGEKDGDTPAGREKAWSATRTTEVTLSLGPDALFEDMSKAQRELERRAIATALRPAGAAKKHGLYPAYFESYFRRGRFFDVVVNPDAAKTALRKQILDGLNLEEDKLTDGQKKMVADAVDALLQKFCKDAKCTILDENVEGAFVNRAGQKFSFPAVTVSIVPGSKKGFEVTKMDEIQVIGDLTHVFWEASFDTLAWDLDLKSYADAKATACQDPADSPFFCIPNDAKKEQQDALASFNLIADRTEGLAGAAAAKYVRGGLWTSLNNEAVAKFLQTTVSVVLRKTAEVVMTANRLYCGPEKQVPVRKVTIRID